MEVIIHKNAAEAVSMVAQIIVQSVVKKPSAVLGLATGKTMEAVYDQLVILHRQLKIDFSLVTTFNLDEYIGLPTDHAQTYRSHMNQRLFHRVNIALSRTFLPDGTSEDLNEECRAYEKKILNAGGIDLQLLGLGTIGHIGFNEPLSSLASRTRTKSLTPETRRQNSVNFGGLDAMPTRAITMGIGTIMEARRCVMLVTGASKAEILARAVEGPITSVVSATALQVHPSCVVVCDEAAATKLEHAPYYRWIFANEPEWEPFRDPQS